jgi:hypothetical protein
MPGPRRNVVLNADGLTINSSFGKERMIIFRSLDWIIVQALSQTLDTSGRENCPLLILGFI